MGRRITFVLCGVRDAVQPTLAAMLNALVRINVEQMTRAARAGHPFPPLYESGVRYEREAEREGAPDRLGRLPRLEEWRDAAAVLEHGAGDCEDLAAYRVAELVAQGVEARIQIIKRPQRPGARGLLHILAAAPWGVEDPSRALGMGAPPS